MSQTWEEEDWILVSTDWSVMEVGLKTNFQCDLCDRHIPAMILCETCKNNRRPAVVRDSEKEVEKKKEETPICGFCGKEVEILFPCDSCKKQLCENCKFGDDIVPHVQCCVVTDESLPPIQPPPPSLWIHKSHQKLFQEFLTLH